MTKESFMIEEISKDIVLLLMKEHGMSMQEAIHALYTSDTYDRLSNLHYTPDCIRKAQLTFMSISKKNWQQGKWLN